VTKAGCPGFGRVDRAAPGLCLHQHDHEVERRASRLRDAQSGVALARQLMQAEVVHLREPDGQNMAGGAGSH
jgi:hypothetical protein